MGIIKALLKIHLGLGSAMFCFVCTYHVCKSAKSGLTNYMSLYPKQIVNFLVQLRWYVAFCL